MSERPQNADNTGNAHYLPPDIIRITAQIKFLRDRPPGFMFGFWRWLQDKQRTESAPSSLVPEHLQAEPFPRSLSLSLSTRGSSKSA